jgi:ATP-binding cassette, subfamily C (CFTR/MRP), member 1
MDVMNATNSSTLGCLNDNTIGPIVSGCRDDFDFTVKFEQSILSLVPSACFALLAAARIAWLSRKPRIVAAGSFQVLKLVSCGSNTDADGVQCG